MRQTAARDEVALLIHGAIDMKITISGNKIVITPLRNMKRGGLNMDAAAAALSGILE